MKELDLLDIRDPKKFQQLCEELFSILYSDFQAVNDTMGDGGCDGFANGGGTFFQIYYPENTGKFPERMNRIKEKIGKSLRKLKKPYPTEWILVTSLDVDPNVHEYINKKKKKYTPMNILIMGEAKLKSLLQQHQDVEKAWLKSIYGSSYEVIPPESVIYGKKNDLPALLEQDKKTADALKDWEFGEYYEQVHTMTSGGRAKLGLRQIHPNAHLECPITIESAFKFDMTPEGNQKRQEFENFLKNGKELKMEGKYLEKFDFFIGRKKVNWIEGDISKSTLLLRRSDPNPVSVTVELLDDKSARIDRLDNITLKATSDGDDGTLLSNSDMTQEIIKLTLLVNRKTNQVDVTLGFDDSKADASAGYKFMNLRIAFDRSSTIRLKFFKANQSMETYP